MSKMKKKRTQLEIKDGNPLKKKQKRRNERKMQMKKDLKERNERKSADFPLSLLIGNTFAELPIPKTKYLVI
jgi:hypothetical protein